MKKPLDQLTERELTIREIYEHLNGIIDNSLRMTSGNYMHHICANILSANIIKKRLESLGIKEEEE